MCSILLVPYAYLYSDVTAPPCGYSGEMQHAVLTLPWHSHIVAVA